MTAKRKITDKNGVQVFPITHTKAVLDDNGNSVEQRLQENLDLINQKQLEVGAVPSDITPTAGSTNWVTSGGVFNSIEDNGFKKTYLSQPYSITYTTNDNVYIEASAYRTNDAIVGRQFSEETMSHGYGCKAVKIPVFAGDVVTFIAPPYSFSALLTDINKVVLIKQGNDGTIVAGYTWNIDVDGYIYYNPNQSNFLIVEGELHADSNYTITSKVKELQSNVSSINENVFRETTINNSEQTLYRNNIWNGKWGNINDISKKAIFIEIKKGWTYHIAVPSDVTAYYAIVADISNALTNNSPVVFSSLFPYNDKRTLSGETSLDVVGNKGDYLWISENTNLNFTVTESGYDYGLVCKSDIEDSLNSDSATKVLSAKQGKALNDTISSKLEHVVDFSSAGKNWGTSPTLIEGTDYNLTADPTNPRLIVFSKLRNIPGSLLTLFITGLTDGETYHWHMEYTSTSTIINSSSIAKQSARNSSQSVVSLDIEESRLQGSGSYTMDFDFVYDASSQFYGWRNQDAFNNGSTLTIESLSITQTKDIHDIYDLAAGGGSSGSVQDDTPKLDEAKFISRNSQNKALSILHFTDIHGDEVAADKIKDYYDKYESYIDDIIDTGDTVYDEYTDGVQFIVDSGLSGTLRTIGNHDTWRGAIPTEQSTVYNYIFAPFVSNWVENGMVQPPNASEEYAMYWYKDYSNEKVRLIGLDCIYQSSSQLSWFTNLLSETLDNSSSVYGFAIVVASHVIPADAQQTTFLHKADGDVVTFSQYGLSVIQNTPAIYFSSDYLNAVDSFITQGGNFAIWLCGHTHRNVVFYPQDHPNMLVLNAAAAGNRVWVGDSATSGTENQYLANIVTIDATTKLIKIIRVGRKYDSYLRAANVLTIDYANKKVIENY